MKIADTNRFIHTHTDKKAKNLGMKAYCNHQLFAVLIMAIFASAYIYIEWPPKMVFRTNGSTVEQIKNAIENKSQLNKGQFNPPLFKLPINH